MPETVDFPGFFCYIEIDTKFYDAVHRMVLRIIPQFSCPLYHSSGPFCWVGDSGIRFEASCPLRVRQQELALLRSRGYLRTFLYYEFVDGEKSRVQRNGSQVCQRLEPQKLKPHTQFNNNQLTNRQRANKHSGLQGPLNCLALKYVRFSASN